MWTLSLVEQGYAAQSDGSIIAIQHLADQQSVCLATTKGDVLLYNTMSSEVSMCAHIERQTAVSELDHLTGGYLHLTIQFGQYCNQLMAIV